MDNLHYRLTFDLDNENEIPGKNILKVVKFQNLVEKCYNVWKIKDLLTECEVCTGKYCDKNRKRYFPVQTEQTRLIRDLLYGFVESQFFLNL